MTTSERSEWQQEWIMAARAEVDMDELAALCHSVTDIASPTGAERELAEFLCVFMTDAKVESKVQVIDQRQANLVSCVGPAQDGGRLLLLAPLDTAFAPGPEDSRWVGPHPRADFTLPARRTKDRIIGLGAENPKAFACSALAVALAVSRSGAPLDGQLIIGLVGGSMPVLSTSVSSRKNAGMQAGTQFMLDHGPCVDAAVVLKPGWSVIHEEVGMIVFRVVVRGALGYTGSRHKGHYSNAIVAAARVVVALEAWFAEYTARHTRGQVAPQGAVTAIRAGGGAKPAFNPETCEFWVDLRVSPYATVNDVAEEFKAVVERIHRTEPHVDIEPELVVARSGSATPADSPVVRKLVTAWEDVEGRPHPAAKPGSGVSDGGVLRRHGLPTARIGFPPPSFDLGPYEGFSMGVADLAGMRRLVDLLIGLVVEVTTSPRAELHEERERR